MTFLSLDVEKNFMIALSKHVVTLDSMRKVRVILSFMSRIKQVFGTASFTFVILLKLKNILSRSDAEKKLDLRLDF